MLVVSVRERGKEEHRFTFRKEEVTVGRLRSNDVILPKRNISKKHAVITVGADNVVTLHDHGSTNGSYINGTRISGDIQVSAEDKLFMGDYIIQVSVEVERSAIGTSSEETAPPPIPDEGEAEHKPTVAQMDSDAVKAELERLKSEHAASNAESGRSSDRSDSTPVQGDETPPTPEVSEDMTLRMEQAEPPEQEEPEEELIDIPLLEEEQEEEDEPVLETTPVEEPMSTPEPAPAPAPSPEQGEAPLPEPDNSTSPLDQVYGELASLFAAWCSELGQAPERGKAMMKIASFLDELVGDALEDIERKQLSLPLYQELSVNGLPERFLSQGNIAEVFIGPDGRVTAFGWMGEILETPRPLSCGGAVRRIAHEIFGVRAGEHVPSLMKKRLVDGTLVKMLPASHFAGAVILQVVRPYSSRITMQELTSTGVLAETYQAPLESALKQGRTILVAGAETEINSLVVHAIANKLPQGKKVLLAGDRFQPTSEAAGRVVFDLASVSGEHLVRACASMGFQHLAVAQNDGTNPGALMRLAGALQIPMTLGIRLVDLNRLPAVIRGLAGDCEDALEALIASMQPLVVVTGQHEGGQAGVVELGELTSKDHHIHYHSISSK